MRHLLPLLFFVLSCASITLPDGTKLQTVGKAEAVVLDRAVDPVIIPFSGRVVSELERADSPCPFLRRQYYDEEDKLINEEHIPMCKSYAKSDYGLLGLLEYLLSYYTVIGL